MAGTYITPCTPTPTAAFVARLESCIKMGTSALYGSLETTSWAYTTYQASIGLKAGQNFELGVVGDLKWSHKPSYEPVETYNIQDDSIYEVTGEETMLTVELLELNPKIIEVASGTGIMYTLGVERLLTFGGGCTMRNRPVSIEFVNDSCNAPAAQDAASGISGGCLTLYDTIVQSGLEWPFSSREVVRIPLELQCRPVLARSLGNRLGNLYIY